MPENNQNNQNNQNFTYTDAGQFIKYQLKVLYVTRLFKVGISGYSGHSCLKIKSIITHHHFFLFFSFFRLN